MQGTQDMKADCTMADTLAGLDRDPSIRALVVDADGELPAAAIRVLFEECLRQTSGLRGYALRREGPGYQSVRTDDLWMGFALGVRCGERILPTLHAAVVAVTGRITPPDETAEAGS